MIPFTRLITAIDARTGFDRWGPDANPLIRRVKRQPVRLSLSDPLSQVRETSSAVMFQTDTLHELTIFEGNADPTTTAYGMLVDMINILRERYR